MKILSDRTPRITEPQKFEGAARPSQCANVLLTFVFVFRKFDWEERYCGGAIPLRSLLSVRL